MCERFQCSQRELGRKFTSIELTEWMAEDIIRNDEAEKRARDAKG